MFITPQVKNNVVRYYEDVDNHMPIKWTFLDSGAEFHVMSFTPGQAMSKSGWKAPAYCFAPAGDQKAAESTRLPSSPTSGAEKR
jgi:hypothetical protein